MWEYCVDEGDVQWEISTTVQPIFEMGDTTSSNVAVSGIELESDVCPKSSR